VTYVISHLEKRGWVRRERVKDDRRKLLVRLTPAGKKVVQDALPGHVQAIVREFSRLSLDEQETLRRLCRKLGRGGAAD
jgi:DNA-binding MarR family transcriptional regulator